MLEVGRITKPHGLRGEVIVELVTNRTERVAPGAVLHSSAGDLVVSRATLDQAFYGLCFAPDGRRLFASGGEYEVVHAFDFADGYLGHHEELRVVPVGDKFMGRVVDPHR